MTNNIDLTQLAIVDTLNARLSVEPEEFGLNEEGNGYINISLADLTDQSDIEKVKPLYDLLGQEADRNFASVEVTKESITKDLYPPALWYVNDKPALRVGGTVYYLLIEKATVTKENQNPPANVYFTSYSGTGKTQVETKHPIFHSVENVKTSNGMMKVLNFTLYVPDSDNAYNFRTLVGEGLGNLDSTIDEFAKSIRLNKPEKALECLSFLRPITYAKKVNLHKAFIDFFKVPGMFEKVSQMYPNGTMGIVSKEQRYYVDPQYGEKVELCIDFAYYTELWGFDPTVNAQGKEVKLSECTWLVFASNQLNTTLKTCFAENYQLPLLLKIVAPNKKNVEFYPEFSIIKSGEITNVAKFFSLGMQKPETLKLEPKKETKKEVKQFAPKVDDFNFS